MPSTHFHCPHCNRLMQKSAPDYIAGEAGGFVSFGSRGTAMSGPLCQ